ncbi:hypothetical protein [Sphingobium chungbukense]|uniref:hypothetical protein n=1 Tax=Sphingobium chungbukense TaxID=56193 RepID=UPI0012EE1C7D|nr:hypothetical protein [Sphingobium chungbukense]
MSEAFSISASPIMIELVRDDRLPTLIDMDMSHHLFTAAPGLGQRLNLHGEGPHHLRGHVPKFHERHPVIGVPTLRRHLHRDLVDSIHLSAKRALYFARWGNRRHESQPRIQFMRRDH